MIYPFLTDSHFSFQSHHEGVGTSLKTGKTYRLNTFNRTMKVLELCSGGVNNMLDGTFNRTMKVLEHYLDRYVPVVGESFNRTMKVLEHNSEGIPVLVKINPFNRTMKVLELVRILSL